MNVINILDAQSANMIAAGEVVERPAAAVKELVENAIDSGADTISVEIKNGGNTLIRVSDNGCGISAEDLPRALLRHATSKIKSGADIDGVMTLGFRGEALAAISAVSRLSIISRTKEDDFGNLLMAEGEEVKVEEVGCPIGTTVLVEELFYNTPARRKFMKKDATEAAACRAVVEKAAISHPEISFRFTSDGEQKIITSGDGSLKNAISDALGTSFAKGLIEVQGEAEGVTVSGYVSTPETARGRNTAVSAFINKRYVVSKTVSAAIKEAFKSYIPHDRYPAAVLFLEMSPKAVDVNVHPAKIEVKFQNERSVYEAVYYGIRTALQRADAFTGDGEDILVTGGDIDTEKIKMPSNRPEGKDVRRFARPDDMKLAQRDAVFSAADFKAEDREDKDVTFDFPTQRAEEKPKEEKAGSLSFASHGSFDLPPKQEQIVSTPAYKYVGEVWNAYVMAETEEAFYIIDKHAAHERILYEKLRKSTTAESQGLLAPVIAELREEEAQILLDSKDYLFDLGFEVDSFGDRSVALRAVPAALKDVGELSVILEQLAASLSEGAALPFSERVDKALFTVACKAAVKAGRRNTAEDNKWIIDRLFESGSIKYCPHGRPVAKVFTRKEANKWFDR